MTIQMMPRLGADYYDEDYFRPGPKSSYARPFTWEEEEAGQKAVARLLKHALGATTVLDAGCAKGFLCKALLSLGVDAYGCDISAFAVSHCELEVQGRLKVADIRDGLPYPKDRFDVVCSFSMLEHIEMDRLPYVVSELARVTNHWVYIDIPVSLGRSNTPWGDPSHRTYMPAAYWISLFYNAGMIIDLRLSSHTGTHPYHNSSLAFSKTDLGKWVK